LPAEVPETIVPPSARGADSVFVSGLAKNYRTYDKQAGLAASLKALVRRRHRTVAAVRGISFSIAPGEIVGFLGPNGAGKTTTLKMLAGLLYPTAGTVIVAGHTPIRRERAFLEAVSLVMGQKMQLAWDLPAADSFLVLKAIYGIDDGAYRKRLGTLVEMLQLGTLIGRPVRQLSLGERMKCELLAALLHDPEVLFLDEPTIGLDVATQLAVRRFIAEYNARRGATVILTSHYMADVTALANRVIMIDRGSVVFDGDLKRLVAEHAPVKVVRLTLAVPASRETLARYGAVREASGDQAELLVPRADVSAIAARLLTDFQVMDIGIEEPPIEDVIGTFLARTSAAPAGEDAA
jgi:ABC-2 type transport system ATP-binding protein